MRSIQWCALALSAARAAYGYVDTSPFFMFSTSDLLSSANKLSSGEAITSDISSTLSHCPSDHYVLISQPGVSAGDYASRKTTPALAQRLSAKHQSNIRSSVSVSEVVGEVDVSRWEQTLERECGAEVLHVDASSGSIPSYKSMPKVLSVAFPAPTTSNRLHDLSVNDAFLESILDMLPSSNYTVLYATTAHGAPEPSAEHLMDAEVQNPLHMEMKRDLSSGLVRRASNQTIVDGPLFEKYQFFTPGIFMGFLVGFILLMILYVGISALSSLQVTYAAFDKDQGALAKTKAQ
ncbi:uncharacterized protein HMPREF1541_06486 [Cyphellophora europaea CBS 101466]|uniref:Protein BIG1 n=1 Tax=Cyphellophora europaea (strain CBS 101466) TaxID=1220924 RepID=W2RPL8_CYPE1|nr:uncharacterized protein HMPREF1541_06486 [Cyphellophora europaea CBS 101466]ETN38451.1 hypothetical protein HMPREF1541_06486 [Cyphellophora europaea CBS 101466]